ncbi:hypothetical protein [Amycolatopsis orientalis]|uniref:hypothetical protein n=1 Tax=Amycolatopsis orientalis TaxID=31958 RepID=UPI00039E9175|nr:hypothetical protein [Amycolatopsis orientalis]
MIPSSRERGGTEGRHGECVEAREHRVQAGTDRHFDRAAGFVSTVFSTPLRAKAWQYGVMTPGFRRSNSRT